MIVVTGYKTELLKKVFFLWKLDVSYFLPLIWLHLLNLKFSHHKISGGVLSFVACYHFM